MDNKYYRLETTLPAANKKFAPGQMVLGGYGLDNPERMTLWAIHSGDIHGFVLPGDLLLENNLHRGEKMEILAENKKVELIYVNQFELSAEGFAFDEGVVYREAIRQGFDLRARKYLALVTCDEYNQQTGEYEALKVFLFVPGARSQA